MSRCKLKTMYLSMPKQLTICAPPLSLRLAAPLFLLLLPLLPRCGSGPVPPRGLRQARAGSGRLAATPPHRGRWPGAAPLRPAAARPRGGRHGPVRKGVRRRVEMKKKGGGQEGKDAARQGPSPRPAGRARGLLRRERGRRWRRGRRPAVAEGERREGGR